MWFVVKACVMLLVVLVPLRLLIHLILFAFTGPFLRVPALLLFSLVWAPIYLGLIGTSWMWIRVPPTRVLLPLLGLLLVILGDVLLMFAPPPLPADVPGRLQQTNYVEEWPVSWLFLDGTMYADP